MHWSRCDLGKAILIICIFITQFDTYNCFAVTLLRRHCDRPIAVGVEMMSKEITYDPSYQIKVRNQNGILENNSIVMAGDTLSMVMEPKVNQAVLEIRGSANLSFTDGYCGGSRANVMEGANIKIPTDISSNEDNIAEKTEVVVTGIWAKSYAQGVKITDPFVFYVSQDNSNIPNISIKDL